MRRAVALLAAGLLGWQAMTVGGSPRAETLTVLTPDGRVLPARSSGRPEAAGGPALPCPGTVALSIDAARALVTRVATQEGFYPEFVLSIAKVESRFVSTALSDKGAYGLMQLMPDSARRVAVDLCGPEANVRGGIRLLRELHARYRNPLFILAAYNAGEDAVRKNRGVPPFPETVRFVADVLNDFYDWPATAAARGPAIAAASVPGIVEVGSAAPAEANATSGSSATGAERKPEPSAPRWDGGFVLHVD